MGPVFMAALKAAEPAPLDAAAADHAPPGEGDGAAQEKAGDGDAQEDAGAWAAQEEAGAGAAQEEAGAGAGQKEAGAGGALDGAGAVAALAPAVAGDAPPPHSDADIRSKLKGSLLPLTTTSKFKPRVMIATLGLPSCTNETVTAARGRIIEALFPLISSGMLRASLIAKWAAFTMEEPDASLLPQWRLWRSLELAEAPQDELELALWLIAAMI
jgi:hypothetical protein